MIARGKGNVKCDFCFWYVWEAPGRRRRSEVRGMEFSFRTEIARLAKGVDEAVFVHRVWFLVMNNEANGRNFHDGKYWTYDSVRALAKIFYFWTPRQLQRIVRNCVEKGLIETGNFAENACDRSTWYTVTETVKSIYANGEMDFTEPSNSCDQTVTAISPNGEMIYREQIKDQIEDQIEGAPARRKMRKEPERQAYGEFGNVRLSGEELRKLCSRWTEEQVGQAIESLSAYMRSKGKRYADHYATLLNWLKRDHPPGASGKLIEEEWAND